jgi:hypothetical protein
MYDCSVCFFVNARVICSDAIVRNLCSRRYLYLFVRLPQFCDVALVFCLFCICTKTCKLEKEELVFLLCWM